MTGEPFLREETVVQIAIMLKGVPEFKDIPIKELIDIACEYLLLAHERIPIVERASMSWDFEKAAASNRIIPLPEAHKVVTGEPKPTRAKQKFERFSGFLLKPNSFITEGERDSIRLELKRSRREGGITKIFCDWVSPLYQRWWQLEQKRLQRVRSKGRKKS